MATLTTALQLTSSGTTAQHSDALGLSVTKDITVTSPSQGISRISSAGNPLGAGAGILVHDADQGTVGQGNATTTNTIVYVRHTGLEAADGTTACAADDYIDITDAESTATGIQMRMYPGEFAVFPLTAGDGTDAGDNDGGLKVTKSSSGSDVMVEYGWWTR